MIIPNKKILASILLILISFVGLAAQRDVPPPPVAHAPPPVGLPIDNGLIVLLVAAIVFGIYKTLELSKKPTQA